MMRRKCWMFTGSSNAFHTCLLLRRDVSLIWDQALYRIVCVYILIILISLIKNVVCKCLNHSLAKMNNTYSYFLQSNITRILNCQSYHRPQIIYDLEPESVWINCIDEKHKQGARQMVMRRTSYVLLSFTKSQTINQFM